MAKISYRWTDRAIRLVESVEHFKAPAEIVRAAQDAVQHFVWATDCRRQSRFRNEAGVSWGPKADAAHYAGKKAFGIAQTWLDDHLTQLKEVANGRQAIRSNDRRP